MEIQLIKDLPIRGGEDLPSRQRNFLKILLIFRVILFTTLWFAAMSQLNFFAPAARLPGAVLLTLWLGGVHASATVVSAPNNGLSVRVGETTGNYEVVTRNPAWKFAGHFEVPIANVAASPGSDAIGGFQQITFEWQSEQSPMRGQIRLYDQIPLVLFADTCSLAVDEAPAPFPSFTTMPAELHVFSYGQDNFAPPCFAASDVSTPWLLFDDHAHSLVVSPASHFMVARMFGDGRHQVASGLNPKLRGLPAGFTQQTLLAFGHGINRTWDLWGRSLLKLEDANRPGNEADIVLKYLGYWTDNGAAYYYNYDTDKGYAGTLATLVERYRQEQIPIRYLQLDSWWYYKSFTGPDGVLGKTKAPALPEGEWNRYGGLLEYKAHTNLFPNGLAAFQKSIGLPLVTHNRWIDPASPYLQQYKISGLAAVDPKWWDNIAAYLKASGVVTYEQDWLDRIYKYSPAFSSNLDTATAFLDNMARACKERGITLQYSMPYPCHFLQGSRYGNLTTIRTSVDRFNPDKWNDFLYTSRLAAAMGIWPWADVFRSVETNNLLLATLSAGPVGIGDAIGTEDKGNLLKAVRADGVIVKPDVSLLPLDRSYIADAQHVEAPLVSSTYTDHNGLKTGYVFAFNRSKAGKVEVRFSPSELGLKTGVYVYDYFARSARRLNAGESFSTPLAVQASAFYEVAPVGKSGVAFLGDADKFASTGKQRIASLRDEPGKLTVDVIFAKTEESVILHGYAASAPKVTALSGKAGPVQYDAATQHFTVELKPDATLPTDEMMGDPVHTMTVVFETRKN